MQLWNMEKTIMANNTLRILLAISITLIVYLFNSIPNAISKDNHIIVPNDFALTLVSAGRGINAQERDTVTINKAGACEYWEQDNIAGAEKNKRNGGFKFQVQRD